MELRSVYKKIKKLLPTMSEANKKIGQYLIENLDDIGNITLSKIARSTNTSDAAITRFCQEIGFNGFFELRKLLINVENNLSINNHEVIIKKEYINNISKFYFDYLNQLSESQENLKTIIGSDEFDEVTNLIVNSDKIIIGATNINYNQAIDFKNKLISIGRSCYLEQETHLLNTLANTCNQNDLFITVSLSNTNKNIIEFGNIAKTNGSKWVHIYSAKKNSETISKFKADYEIFFTSNENEIWNQYSIRGEILFQLFNILFINILKSEEFLKKWKK